MDEIKKEVSSNQFAINIKDIAKGFIIAVLGAVLTVVQTSLDAGSIDIDWSKTLVVGVTAGVAYLIKNFFEPAQVRTVVSNEEAKAHREAGDSSTSK